MTPFFRRIRHKLANDNQFLKYSRYAIGEIVLVVIGILIALQINNWNEGRKIKELERVYLERFKIDLAADSIYLTRRIKESSASIKGCKFFLLEAYRTQNNFDDYMTLVNNLLWNSEHFVVQKSTYDELNNSGQLNILSNKQLKNSILNHYLIYESNSSHIKEGNEFSVGEMSKIISILFNYCFRIIIIYFYY